MSIKVQSLVWETSLPTNRKIVLLKLADAADDDGSNAWPSIDFLVAVTGVSKSTVKTILREFRDEGIITAEGKIRGGRGKTTNYTVHMDVAQALFPFDRPKRPTEKPSVVFHSDPPKQHEIVENVARALNARAQSEKGSTVDPFSPEALKSLRDPGKGSTVDPFPEKGSIRNLKGSNPALKGSTALTPNHPLEPSLEPGARARGDSGAIGSDAAAPSRGASSDPPAGSDQGKPPPLIHTWRHDIFPKLCEILGDHSCDAWFKHCIPHEVTAERYTLACPNDFIRAYIRDKFHYALRAATGRHEVDLIVTNYCRFQYDKAKRQEKRN